MKNYFRGGSSTDGGGGSEVMWGIRVTTAF